MHCFSTFQKILSQFVNYPWRNKFLYWHTTMYCRLPELFQFWSETPHTPNLRCLCVPLFQDFVLQKNESLYSSISQDCTASFRAVNSNFCFSRSQKDWKCDTLLPRYPILQEFLFMFDLSVLKDDFLNCLRQVFCHSPSPYHGLSAKFALPIISFNWYTQCFAVHTSIHCFHLINIPRRNILSNI